MDYQKDFLLSQIKQFTEAVQFAINGKNDEEKVLIELNQISELYLDNSILNLLSNSLDDNIKDFKKGNNAVELIQITAELFYQTAIIEKKSSHQQQIFKKSLELFEYLQNNSDVFSFEIDDKITEMRNFQKQ